MTSSLVYADSGFNAFFGFEDFIANEMIANYQNRYFQSPIINIVIITSLDIYIFISKHRLTKSSILFIYQITKATKPDGKMAITTQILNIYIPFTTLFNDFSLVFTSHFISINFKKKGTYR